MSTRVLVSMFGIIVALVAPRGAAAESELVVIGPVAATSKVSVAEVQTILDKGEVAPRSAKAIDAACAIDATCLAAAGTELAARRVLAVSVSGTSSKEIALVVLLVDVASKDLLARRALTIPTAKLGKDLGGMLKTFVDEAPVQRAKELFAMGNEHYNLGEFVQALDMYKRAYRAKALSAFQFNIAQCHRKLGQYREAVAMYQSYLVGVANAPNKQLVESLIAESRAKIAEGEAALADTARRDAERVAAEKQKAEALRRAKEAELAAAAERTKAEQARINADREIYDQHPARTWAFVGAGVGALALVGGGVFGLRARNAQTSFDDAGCGEPDRLLDQVALARCIDDRDGGQRNAGFANIFLGTGAALLVVSAVVLVIDPGNVERPEQARARISMSPTSVELMVRW